MPLSLNEIRNRALQFSNEWKDESRERAEAQTFWNQFFEVFGVSRRRVATFDEPAKKTDGQGGFIDMLWKGNCLVEHKSKGKDLDIACKQAFDYFPGLQEKELPRYVIVSDFAHFRVYDLDKKSHVEFPLKNLSKNIHLFGFISGYQQRTYKEEDPVNIEAAQVMGKLHDELKEIGYAGHDLEVYLVRLLFCMFADDTGIFEKDCFHQYIEKRTSEDGSDLANHLAELFQVLNTAEDKRLKTLDESLGQFPYVNGKLFEENLHIAAFNKEMRQLLIDCCYMDWGKISPAIFGSLFQSVMDPEKRRNLGAHYTSEKNILKLIKPLFIDELWKEFESIKSNPNKLKEFHIKLSTLRFFDPACGCGNFLVISYRELRLLEIEILRCLIGKEEKLLKIEMQVLIDVDQFYGIEIEEFPARIAEVAMWLIDHQMNMRISEEFGRYFVRLPLKKSPSIYNKNALQMDWKEIIKPDKLSYILGNPPFVGKHLQNDEQKNDMEVIFGDIDKSGLLDYVTAWYVKAAQYIKGTKIQAAFVSTNSITQGEQVEILWKPLIEKFGIKIHFAHRTFKWSNEAKGNAGVFVVIIGFSNFDIKNKTIWDYDTPKSEAHEITVKNINPYLVDAPNIFISSRRKPLCNSPAMMWGNKPVDGGHLILSEEEKQFLITEEPNAAKFIRPLLSADNYLNNIPRWCLWLVNADPKEIRSLPLVMSRIDSVKKVREKSVDAGARGLALTPTRFRDIQNPASFILVPLHTSEKRNYIPMGFFDKKYIANNSCAIVPDATLYHFGILTSAMHMAWMKYTCGRLESRYRYSKDIVYNNFPWPKEPSKKNIKAVEEKAQKVLDVRAKFPESSLADLYDPLTMPAELVKGHNELDKAVDVCYRAQAFVNDSNRIEYLFGLYNEYTEPLIPKKKTKRSK
jgi:type I restriction-modification system DNA methylase subunit